ncbi:Dicer-like protein 1 [Coemansia sp. RSA 2336]|nr:Dicer-like protein 1 [Coemansia sp. RSA 2336]
MTEDTGTVLKPRSYQLSLFREALKSNSIVMLETGTGKTLVAVMLIEWFAKHASNNKAASNKRRKVRVFLNNTVALVHQQAQVISRNTDQTVHEYVGAMGMEDWDEATWTKTWTQADVLVMTHQVLLNALRAGRARITDIDLLVFDEAHHARGNHPYALIMREFYDHCAPEDRPHIFSMTASPLNKQQTAQESVRDLQASLDSNICTVDLTTDSLASVSAPTAVCYEYALPPEFHDTPLTQALAGACSESRVVARGLKLAAVVLPLLGPFGVDQLWHYYIRQWHRSAAMRPAPSYKALPSAQAPSMVSSTDGADDPLLDIAYLKRALEINRTFNQATAAALLASDHDLVSVDNEQVHPMPQIRALAPYRRPWAEILSQLSPQVNRLLGILIQWRENPRSLRGIVFTNRRITAILLVYIVSLISEFDFIRADVLLGSAQKSTSYFDRPIRSGSARMVNQLTLADFADGRLNLVFATQVAEEGVDIQPCNLVIRFDMPKTTTSLIQSRGRARMADSQFIVMVPQIEADEGVAVSATDVTIARLDNASDQDHATIYADSGVVSQPTGASQPQRTLPEHMGTYTDYLQLVRLEECLREWCRVESQTANASTPGSSEVIISRNYAHQEYGRMHYNLRSMLRIDSSSGTEIDDIWVEQGDTQGRIYTIVATQARITYMSAIPTIMSYVQHLPQDPFCKLMPIYEFEQIQNKPPPLPHLHKKRSPSPTSSENGRKHVKASAKPLHKVLFRCTLTLPSNAAVRQVVGPLMPNKRLAKQSVAYRMAKKLHQVGAIDDNLCPIVESDDSLETNNPKQPAKQSKKRKSKGTRSSVGIYPIATPQVFIPPTVPADSKSSSNKSTSNPATEDDACERDSSHTWHAYAWTLKHPSSAEPTRIAFLSANQMPSDIVLPLYVKQYDPSIEPEKSGPTAFSPKYLGPQVLSSSQVETLASFSSKLLLRFLSLALSWDVAKVGSLLAPLNRQGNGIDLDLAESIFADRSVIYEEGVTDYSHLEGTLVMDAFNRGSIKVIENICDSVGVYSNLRVYHAEQKGLDTSAAAAEPVETAKSPSSRSAKRIKSRQQVTTLEEWSKLKRIQHLCPSEQAASGVPLFKVRILSPSINYLSITVAANTAVDDDACETPSAQEGLEFPDVIYTSPFFCTREPLSVDDIMNLSLLPALLTRLNQTLLAYEVKSKLEHPARVHMVRQAITASSAASDVNYERLETLGDSVLKFIASVETFVKYPDAHEGILSFQRKRIISNANLCDRSLQLNLPPYIIATTFSRRDVRLPGDGWMRMPQIPTAWMYQAPPRQEPESSGNTASNVEDNRAGTPLAVPEASSNDTKEAAEAPSAIATKDDTPKKTPPAHIAVPTSRILSEKTAADIIESLLGASVYDCDIDAALSTARSLGIVDSGWTSWSAFDSVWRAERASRAYKMSQIKSMQLDAIANAGNSEDTKDLLQEMKLDQSDVLYKLESHKQPLDLAYGMDLSTEQALGNCAQLGKEAVQQIENTLGYTFRDHSLLLEALTHCSSLDLSSSSYQRLEYLGDAILDFLLTKRYFDHQPPLNSHRITLIKHVAASNDLFGVILVQHGLHKYIRHSSSILQRSIDDYELRLEHACRTWRGNRESYQTIDDMAEQPSEPSEARELDTPPMKQRRVSSGLERLDTDIYADLPPEVWNSVRAPKVLGDLLESLIGAVYVDAGMDFGAVVRVYEHMLSPFLSRFVDTGKLSLHPVIHTLLVCQGWGCDMVAWKNITDPNPLEYKNRYTCHVTLHDKQVATGSGESPRHAKYNAATAFLAMIGASAPNTLDGDLKAIQDVNNTKNNSQDKESKLDSLLKPVCTCAERRLEETKQRAAEEEEKKRLAEEQAQDGDTKDTAETALNANSMEMDVADTAAVPDTNNEQMEEGEIK